MSGFQGQFDSGAVPVLQKALAFYESRNALIARNIAHASTPGYRPVDLDEGAFQAALKKAVAERASTHLREFRMEGGFREVAVREGQVRHDGNAINMERQQARLADNTIAFERAAQMLSSSFRVLEIAIRGRS